MTLVLFEGGAGTGKTTRLVAELRSRLRAEPLRPDQRVLALTKYHGSRRRMESRLRATDGVPRLADCITLDSFAWRLVQRWRGLVRHLGVAPQQGDYQSITSTAGSLLRAYPTVAAWVGRRYPVVAVDEMQDFKGGEVEVVAGLNARVHLVCAADAFQDLSGAAECEALTWARTAGDVVVLDFNHRTSVTGLVAAARALRDGKDVQSDRASGFEVVTAPRFSVAGGRLSWRLRIWSSLGTAVISPTRPGTSPFVDGVIGWVTTKKAKGNKPGATAGPFSVAWESDDEHVCGAIASALALPDDPDAPLECSGLRENAARIRAADLCAWIERERSLAGRSSVTVEQVRQAIARIVHRRRAFGRSRERRRLAMTIHQAKNREFDSVVVLWPLRLQPDVEQQRRLLYNAITRARRQALVIVEDPGRARLATTPFRASQ